MKRLKGCISLLVILFGMTFFLCNGNVQAKVVTDDAGDQVDIPDKYFINPNDNSKAENSRKIWTFYRPFLQEWVDNPSTNMSDINTDIVKAVPDITTFNDFVDKMSEIDPGYPKDYLKYTLGLIVTNHSVAPLMSRDAEMDTEGVLVYGRSFTYIVQPSDITVYNQTGNIKISQALKYGFKQWEKDPRFKFRMVDDPKEARIIVTDVKHSRAKSTQFESDFDAFFSPDIVYKNNLVQGEIVLAPSILSMEKGDPRLLHVIVHELGHSIGRPDLF